MYRSYPRRLSYFFTLPFELREEVLLALPPKEILSICSRFKEFKRVCSDETFWKRVWLKWVSPRLPKRRDKPIWYMISLLVENAKRLTPEKLLEDGSREGILFYVIEALEKGANVSAREDEALRTAVFFGYFDIVKYLVEKGANVSAREDEALRTAAFFGYFDIVKYLVEKGANVSARDNEALRQAALKGHLDVVKYLVEKGANISARENEALSLAAYFGRFDVVRYLVEKGADVSARDNEALRWATKRGHTDIVRYLTERGKGPSFRGS
jgi:hypothetical protein